MTQTVCYAHLTLNQLHKQFCIRAVVVNQEGDTPFPIECLHDNLDWVKVLISKHVDPKVNGERPS